MLIAGNWKMHKSRAETRAFLEAFEPPAGVEAVVCPTYASLEAAVGHGVPVFAQNVHWEIEGAYTGEVSAEMLAELGRRGSASSATRSDGSTSARTTTASRCERTPP